MRAKILLVSAAMLIAAPVLAQTGTTTPSTTPSTKPPSSGTTTAPSATTTPGTMKSTDFRGMKANDLIGKTVYNSAGESVGEIDDLVISKSNKATAAVVGVGGFLGMGERKAAIPLDQMSMQGDRVVAANLTKDEVKRMGEFQAKDWARYDRNRPIGEATGN
jgi:sporulation protein YlmC with PRC-barrel domain